MLIIQKDRIEHAATRMLTQSQINPEAGPKSYDEYVKIRYPYLETAKKREHDDAIARLNAEVKKGPMVIRPMGEPNIKSKLHKKIQRSDLEKPSDVSSRLMKKIGRSLPL